MARPPRVSVVPHVLTVLLVLAVIGALARAQSKEFYAQRTALQNEAKNAQQAAGLAGPANAKSLYKAYPTPEIALAAPLAVQEDQAAALSLAGRFADKTTFMSGTSGFTLSNIAVAANKFSATALAAPGFGPAYARVYAFSPVSAAETWLPVFVGTPRPYTLTAKNGWTVKLTPDATKFALDQRSAKVGYKAEFFKPGETKPFETTTGTLQIDANSSPDSGLQFSMRAGTQGSAMAELEQVSNRMAELMKAGQFQSREMTELNKRMEALQERMTKELEAQLSDPAAMQRKQDEFGCESIFLSRKGDGVTGSVSCGKNVGSLDLQGK